MKIALVGDSILDNAAYVGDGGDVAFHLRSLLPATVEVELIARDGSRVEQIEAQLGRVPDDATHIVISAGGNDAIDSLGYFDMPVSNVAEALRAAADLHDTFRYRYRSLMACAASRRQRVTVCTIYEPRFDESDMQRAASVALTVFNDVILGESGAARIPVLDLRRVCTKAQDYANPIEPSATGGRKIAQALTRFVTDADMADHGILVYW